MSDTSIKRFAAIVSDGAHNSDDKQNSHRTPPAEWHWRLAEGWFSLFLLALVIYSTIWSVQLAGWVDHLDILTLTTAVGLILGVIAAKQQRFSHFLVYGLVLGFGVVLAFWQTAGACCGGNVSVMGQYLVQWVILAISGGASTNTAIFLFLIVLLGYVLAAMSAWLVYAMHSPWLMILANAVILLINLNNLSSGFVVFLIVFLIAALLLLLRLNLYESVTRWRTQGLRYGDNLTSDIMQAGIFVSIGILFFACILPNSYTDSVAAQVWNSNLNPVGQWENTWDRLITVNGGSAPANHGNFSDTLTLGGNPNLTNDVVLTLQTTDTDVTSHYLAMVSYDTYNNGQWSLHASSASQLNANTQLAPSASQTQIVKQTITIKNAPGEQNAYIPGTPEINEVSVPATVTWGNGGIIAWLGKNNKIPVGTAYTVTSTLSTASVATLKTVPLPKDAPTYPTNVNAAENVTIPITAYSPALVQEFTQMPTSINQKQFAALAQQIVTSAHASTMYDQAMALANYFQEHYSYSTNIHPLSGEDPAAWFLFDNSAKTGFCNYFASAMVLLARSLGMPARVVSGYAPGDIDINNSDQTIVHGKQAHTWAQIYFAGYGWINFEPSTSFLAFTRPAGNVATTPGSGATGGLPSVGISGSVQQKRQLQSANDAGSAGNVQNSANASPTAQLRQDASFAGGSLLLLLLLCGVLMTLWWRRLFRRYSLATQLYGRICVLAQGAGIPLQPWQTPYEYLQSLKTSTRSSQDDALALERLGDIYVRERWADPTSQEHPLRSGEVNELPAIWRRLRPHLLFYMLRHPRFLRALPARVRRMFGRLRRRRVPHNDLVAKHLTS